MHPPKFIMFCRVFFAMVASAAAQSCTTTGAGTDACACVLATCADVSTVGTSVSKTTTLGTVTGKTYNGADQFWGVPVAATTAGANRFKPPQATFWSTPVSTVTEKPCPYAGSPIAGTENCLTVDVIAATGVTGMATAMYVHGGGFTGQNPYFNLMPSLNNFKDYNFNGLTNGGKTIFVIAHYRLGALGWMAHPGFRGSTYTANGGATGINPGSGNWGMGDAINALSWISANIATFGGDPTKVTTFGESAGAAHVLVLAASPLTVGLSQAFIMESPYVNVPGSIFSMSAREEMATLYTYRTGCTTAIAVPDVTTSAGASTAAVEAQCLRSASILLLIPDVGFSGAAHGGLAESDPAKTAFNAVYGTDAAKLFLFNAIHCWPVIDGFFMTKPPLESMSMGNNVAATIVVGHNADEYTTFCGAAGFSAYGCGPAPDPYNHGFPLALMYLPTTASFSEMLAGANGAFGGAKIQAVKAGLYYSDLVGDTTTAGFMDQKAIQMGNDAWFAVTTMSFAQAALDAPGRLSGTVFYYMFAQETDRYTFPWMGACHGCELTFALGFYTGSQSYLTSMMPASMGLTGASTTGDAAVGNAMNGYWASIYYTGSPNVASTGLPHWSPMTSTDKNTMVFSGDITLGAATNPCLRAAVCRTEQSKFYRMNQKQFWGTVNSDTFHTYLTTPTCTAAPTVFTTHMNGATLSTPLNCSYLPCCTYSSGRRSLLFGMPSSSGSSSCDPMC